MATPLGHSLAGYLVYRGLARCNPEDSKLFLVLCVSLAITPDLDFVPGILEGTPALYHQGISHSLVFAVVAGLIVSLGYQIYSSQKGAMLANWGLFTLSYMSHLLIDLVGPDKRLPYGIPLFWPVTDATYLSPIKIFLGVRHAKSTSTSTSEWLSAIVDPHNLGALSIEVAVLLPWILLVVYAQRKSQEKRRFINPGGRGD
jgi:inner membrane protein